MKYSPSTNAFYHPAVHGHAIPADAVAVSPEEHATLLAAQARGEIIRPDENGQPVAVAPAPHVPTRAELLAAINAEKNRRRDGGFTVDGVLWDSDYAARLAYAEVRTAFDADPAYTVEWKASAGQWVTLDKALYDAVRAAGAAHIAAAFAWQRQKEEELAALPDGELGTFTI
jgi:hypothetical protein